MAPTLVILNPLARGERAAALVSELTSICEGAQVEVTQGPEDAHALASRARARGFQTVVAAGGDGTINQVVNGIAHQDLTLGLMPLGTMNVFATELGLPSNNLAECWRLIREGQTRGIDLPSANGRYFVQMGGIGLDAQAVQETSGEFKKQWGPLSYVINAAQIAARPSPKLRVASGDKREGSFVLVGNGRYYGGPFTLFKEAKLDDGKLDIVIFRNLGYLDIVRYLQAVLFGLHPELPDVDYFQAESFEVTADDPIPVEVDGDVITTVPVQFTVKKQGLRVIAPPARG